MMTSLILALVAQGPAAHAEGSAELPGQWLLVETTLHVDILDPEVERIAFEGAGAMNVRAPDGTDLGNLFAGSEISLTGLPAGAYSLVPLREQRGEWSVTVADAVESGGRLFSYDWALDARGYEDTYGFDGDFFARVDGGADGHSGVVMLELNGWTGHRWNAIATSHGVDGEDAGRSVDRYLAEVDPSVPLYLSPPTVVGSAPVAPSVANLSYTPFEEDDEFGGVFTLDVDVRGTWRIVCDTTVDGKVDPTDNASVVLSGLTAGAETIEVEWDGRAWDGEYVNGAGECGATLSVGELHFLADDIETAYPGLRMFSDDGGLPMFWNDAEVANDDVPMENGELPAVASGADGVASGDDGAPAEAGVNARAWGNFMDAGKGDRSMLDTWSFLQRSTVLTIDVPEFGGPGDRSDSGGNQGSGAQEPESELSTDGLTAGGYYKGGCSTTAGAGSTGALAFLAGLVALGLRRRD